MLIIAVDSDPVRAQMAKQMGADAVLNFEKTDVIAEINMFGTVDAACGCQTWPYGTVENRNPVQAQGELARVPEN